MRNIPAKPSAEYLNERRNVVEAVAAFRSAWESDRLVRCLDRDYVIVAYDVSPANVPADQCAFNVDYGVEDVPGPHYGLVYRRNNGADTYTFTVDRRTHRFACRPNGAGWPDRHPAARPPSQISGPSAKQ